MIAHVLRNDGVLALYNGLTASILRQVSECAPVYVAFYNKSCKFSV